MNELEARVKALECRVAELEEKTTPLKFPETPTYILDVLYYPLEKMVIAAKIALIKDLPVYLCYWMPVSDKTTIKQKDGIRGNMYLDMIYRTCCDSAIHKQPQSIICQCLGNPVDLKLWPAYEELKEKRDRISSEMIASGTSLGFPSTLQSKLYKMASEKLRQEMANMARVYSQRREEDID